MGSSPAGQQLLFLLLVVLGFVLLVVRPARARARALEQVRASLAVGVEVMTSAGLFARVVELRDDELVLEIAPGVHARFAAAAVVRVVERPGGAADAPRGPEAAP